MRIYPPKHLSAEAQEVYKTTAHHLKEAGIYHPADQPMLESYAGLVVRLRELEKPDEAADPDGRAKTISAVAARIGAIARQLGLDYVARRTRQSAATGRGRPAKNAGVTTPPNEEKAWLTILDGGR